MLAIINYNNDIAEYWEWLDTAWLPVDMPWRHAGTRRLKFG